MPFGIIKEDKGYFVINLNSKKKYNKIPHKSKLLAQKQMTAIQINYSRSKKSK